LKILNGYSRYWKKDRQHNSQKKEKVAGVAVSILGIFCFIFSKICKTGDDTANIARLGKWSDKR
jgi:hypothetical protein